MQLRVLVVDDEPLAREELKLLLGRHPQVESVSEARNGREAVARIREQKADLVLLDVQMPRTDGFAVVHAIGAERMPPVIFVTAHDQYAIRAFEVAAIESSEPSAGYEACRTRRPRDNCWRCSMPSRMRRGSWSDSRFDPASVPSSCQSTRWIGSKRSELRPTACGPGDPPAARAHEHDRYCARYAELSAHPSIAYR
jgi:CheY-like chemotaxis protein